jgi:hypothetical protein
LIFYVLRRTQGLIVKRGDDYCFLIKDCREPLVDFQAGQKACFALWKFNEESAL